jgi:hypothetical protein
MARVATKLAPTAQGGFRGRKRIPADVQDEYQKLYGKRHEERFNSGAVPAAFARKKHRDWLSEIEARIENIRAERKGAGRTLTPMQARALSADWYRWFTTRRPVRPEDLTYWKEFRSNLIEQAEDGA